MKKKLLSAIGILIVIGAAVYSYTNQEQLSQLFKGELRTWTSEPTLPGIQASEEHGSICISIYSANFRCEIDGSRNPRERYVASQFVENRAADAMYHIKSNGGNYNSIFQNYQGYVRSTTTGEIFQVHGLFNRGEHEQSGNIEETEGSKFITNLSTQLDTSQRPRYLAPGNYSFFVIAKSTKARNLPNLEEPFVRSNSLDFSIVEDGEQTLNWHLLEIQDPPTATYTGDQLEGLLNYFREQNSDETSEEDSGVVYRYPDLSSLDDTYTIQPDYRTIEWNDGALRDILSVGDSSTGREVIMDIPVSINQADHEKWPTLRASEDIPNWMLGRPLFSFTPSFDTVSTTIKITKDNELKAQYHMEGGSADEVRRIAWDAQTCGTYDGTTVYNQTKVANEDCETGTYNFRLEISYLDGDVVKSFNIPEEGAPNRDFEITNEPTEPTTIDGLAITWANNKPYNPDLFESIDGVSRRYRYNATHYIDRNDDRTTGYSFTSNYQKTNYELRLEKREGTTVEPIVDFGGNITGGANTNENISWNELCGTEECPELIGSEEYWVTLYAFKDLNGNGRIEYNEEVRYEAPVEFDQRHNGERVSCALDVVASNTTTEYFDPDTQTVTFKYKVESDDVSNANINIQISGPHHGVPVDPETEVETRFNLPLVHFDNLLPLFGEYEWDGTHNDETIEDGVYLVELIAKDPRTKDELCNEMTGFGIRHSAGTGDVTMDLHAVKKYVEEGDYQELEFDTNIESVRTVVNLYRTDSLKPVRTVWYHCGPKEKCPEVSSNNLKSGERKIKVAYENFERPGRYYFKASIKTTSGKVYKASSNEFEPLQIGGPLPVSGCQFADVDPSSIFFEQIQRVCELGIMVGSPHPYDPNIRLFEPNRVMNRIEGITISNRLAQCTEGRNTYNPLYDGNLGFPDMDQYMNPSSEWMFPEIKKGIICLNLTGYGDNTLRPAQNLLTAESWKIVLEAVQTSGIANFNPIYANLNQNPWWRDYEFFLVQNGFNPAFGGGPQTPTTRAEVAALIYDLEVRGLITPIEALLFDLY